MGVIQEVLVSCELWIFTFHFQHSIGAKIFWGFFPFECQYHPTSSYCPSFNNEHVC